MQRGDSLRADGEDRAQARRAVTDTDPMRGVEAALEELRDALRDAQRSLDVIDTDPPGTPLLAGEGAAAEENRAIRHAYARLAADGARGLRDELAQVRARAAAMARQARELRTRVPETTTTGADRVGREDAASSSAPVVDRAVAFVAAHADREITVEDIAVAAGVGVRRLQEAFRDQRDTTPTRFLRAVRLERAHADLVVADPAAGCTVAEVAGRWGFAHAGRFAGLYRRVYGCHPRYTLDTPP